MGGRLHDRRRSGERHHPNAGVARLIRNESPRGRLCCGNSAGFHVGGAHAAGGVHGEDDGFVLGRQGDDGGRARDGGDHHGQGRQEQKRREVTPESVARAHGLLHYTQARIPERHPLLPAHQQDVSANERRHAQQQPEHVRP